MDNKAKAATRFNQPQDLLQELGYLANSYLLTQDLLPHLAAHRTSTVFQQQHALHHLLVHDWLTPALTMFRALSLLGIIRRG